MKAAIRNRPALLVIVLLVAALLIAVAVVVPGQTASYNSVNPESASGGQMESLGCPPGYIQDTSTGLCVSTSASTPDDLDTD